MPLVMRALSLLRPAVRCARGLGGAATRWRYELTFGACGRRLRIQNPLVVAAPRQVEVGDDVSFSAYIHIWGAGGVKIGNRVMIGSHTAITSLTHDPTAEVMFGTTIAKPVVIEDDVWIGSHCVILPGVRVGCGAVIAAGGVVTQDVPPWTIVAGVPARMIKRRRSAESQ